MLIPLGTDRPLHRPTVVTIALVAANLLVFGVQEYLRISDPDRYKEFVGWAWVWGREFHWYALITSAFLHGGFLHLAGNMVVLWVFGPNIEDRLGRLWFLLFYLLGAAASGGLHAALSPNPAIGASGAIAAVTGAYLVMFPRTIVRCFWLLGLVPTNVPAWWFIGFAVVWDFLMQGAGSMGMRADRIAHLAHIGGYLYGAGVAFALLWLHIIPREPWDLFTQGKQALRRRQIRAAARESDRAVAEHWKRAKGEQPGSGGGAGGAGGGGGGGGVENGGGQRFADIARESDTLAADRAAITKLITAHDFPAAGAAYKKLADTFAHLPNATLLSRTNQLDLANWYYKNQDSEAAAYAYARFLEGYPKDSESGQVRLLLGLIHARALNDPIQAKALITQAIEELRDDSAIEIAKRELAALG